MRRPTTINDRRRLLAGARARRGSVLILVLVVVVMLAVLATNYTNLMMTELEAVSSTASESQTRALVDSGADYAATLLANRAEPGLENLQHNPALFQGVLVADGTGRARSRGRFTILSPLEQDTAARKVRYGLIDESAKLNINLINKLGLDEETARIALMGLPGMTESIADAMLDFVDADDNVRQYGAESETYESKSPSYSAKNGPLETLEELLLVEGMTVDLLYGEDANRNGLLDPNEDDGDASLPLDNGDGILQHGLSAYLTVVSREVNVRADGTPRIDVNNGLLTDLYDQIAEEFDESAAKFVIAYRIAGSGDTRPATSTTSASGKTVASSTTAAQATKQIQNLATNIGKTMAEAMASGGKVTRGGIDLSKGAQYQVKSIWELVDSKSGSVMVNGTSQKLQSPWVSTDATTLVKLMDTLSTTSDPYLEGRINVNQARSEVLSGLPPMTTELLEAITNGQHVDNNGAPMDDVIQGHATTGWLLTEGLVDIWGMRDLDPYITTRGDVYRAQIMGFFDGGGPVTRVEVMIDATARPPKLTLFRDLTDLGRGYTRLQYQGGQQ